LLCAILALESTREVHTEQPLSLVAVEGMTELGRDGAKKTTSILTTSFEKLVVYIIRIVVIMSVFTRARHL